MDFASVVFCPCVSFEDICYCSQYFGLYAVSNQWKDEKKKKREDRYMNSSSFSTLGNGQERQNVTVMKIRADEDPL